MGPATTSADASPAARRRAAGLVLALCALTLLAVTACSGSSASPTASPTSTGHAVSLDVTISDGTVSPTPGEVPVALGSTVHLTVTSDTADDVHVHGYDLEKTVPAGGTVTFDFTADQAGTFEVETHESDLLLTKLVVS